MGLLILAARVFFAVLAVVLCLAVGAVYLAIREKRPRR